jgi:hypothetical protein
MDNCAICGATEELKKCSRCKRVCYCSKEHQKSHWKIHKTDCKPFDIVNQEPESSTLCFDAVRIDCRNCKDIVTQSDWIHKVMTKFNLCIMDGFLKEEVAESIFFEAKWLRDRGRMVPGQLSGGKAGSDNSKKYSDHLVRGDEIAWLEGCEEGCSSIGVLMAAVDALVVHCNRIGRLPGCKIQSRTKVFLAQVVDGLIVCVLADPGFRHLPQGHDWHCCTLNKVYWVDTFI